VTLTRTWWVIAGWLIIVAGAASLLSSSLMFPTPLLWMRISPPILLLFGAFAELRPRPDYRLVLGTIGAWILFLVVFYWNLVGDRAAYVLARKFPHPELEVPNAVSQLVFAVLVVFWVHWRTRLIRRKLAESPMSTKT
jgi:hypothetical protein